jgi:hypothetical protein
MSASNGVQPGSSGRLLRGQGAIGGAQEAGDKPTMVSHPHGLYVGRDGGRYNVGSVSGSTAPRDGDMTQIEC